MGLFDSSENVTTTRPQFPEGMEVLVPQLTQMAQRAYSTPYQTYGQPRIAGFSQDQQAGMNAVRGMATDPRYGRTLDQSESAIGSSMDDRNLSAMIGSLGRTIQPRNVQAGRVNAGRVGTGTFDRAQAARYADPYQSQVIDEAARRMGQQTDAGRAALQRRQAGKKAFGSGADLASANFENEAALNTSGELNRLLQQGFQQGRDQFNTEEGRNLQAGTTNLESDLRAQTTNLGADLQAQTANQNAGLTAEQLRTQGLTAGTGAENTRLAGRRAAGNDLGQAADRRQQGYARNAQSLLGIGEMERGLGQQNLDLQYQDFQNQRDYDRNQTAGLAGILYGAPRGSTTTTPGPSMASQLAGAAVGIGGAGRAFGWWADGGAVARLASGGAPDDGMDAGSMLAALNDPNVPEEVKAMYRQLLRSSEGIGQPEIEQVPLPPGPMGSEADAFPMPMPKPPVPETANAVSRETPSGEDRYGQLLEKLLANMNPDQDKWLAVAQAGARMASSSNPRFLGALGEGASAGIDAFRRAKADQGNTLTRAAGIEQSRQTGLERREDRRLTQDRLALADRERGEDRKDTLEFRRQQAQDQKDLREAQLGQGRWSVQGTDAQGNAVLVDSRTGETKTVEGVKPRQGATGNSVFEQKKAAYLLVNPGDDAGALEFAAGRRRITQPEAIRAATAAAKAKAATEMDPTRSASMYNSEYARLMEAMGFSGAQPEGAPATQAPAAPAGGAPAKSAPTKTAPQGALPPRPAGVPPSAQYSPSGKSWWWQENGVWKRSQ